MWKMMHSKWTVWLQDEWNLLQWTLCGRYCTAVGQWYCGLNVVCYSEHYVEGTAQQVDSVIVAWMECVTVNSIWKILHSRWTVVLWVEWSLLQWTLCGRYCTACGQWYCGLNVVCYREQYVEFTAQDLKSVLQLECSALQLSSTETEEHEHWTIMTNEVFFSLNWKTLRWLNWRNLISIGNISF